MARRCASRSASPVAAPETTRRAARGDRWSTSETRPTRFLRAPRLSRTPPGLSSSTPVLIPGWCYVPPVTLPASQPSSLTSDGSPKAEVQNPALSTGLYWACWTRTRRPADYELKADVSVGLALSGKSRYAAEKRAEGRPGYVSMASPSGRVPPCRHLPRHRGRRPGPSGLTTVGVDPEACREHSMQAASAMPSAAGDPPHVCEPSAATERASHVPLGPLDIAVGGTS